MLCATSGSCGAWLAVRIQTSYRSRCCCVASTRFESRPRWWPTFWEKWKQRHDRPGSTITCHSASPSCDYCSSPPNCIHPCRCETYQHFCILYNNTLHIIVPTYFTSPHPVAMDNPTEEITGVVHKLCQGSPAEQVRHQP